MPPTKSITEVECILVMCPQFHHILRFHIKLISFIMIFILTTSTRPLIMCKLNPWASSKPQKAYLSHQNAYMGIQVAKFTRHKLLSNMKIGTFLIPCVIFKKIISGAKCSSLQQHGAILRSKYHRKQQRKKFPKARCCEP